MDIVKLTLETLFRGDIWRYVILVIVIVGSLFWMLSLAPISQNTTHHNFADTRDFHCVPNFLDVVTNLPFLIVGIAGLCFCWGMQEGGTCSPWILSLAAVISGYLFQRLNLPILLEPFQASENLFPNLAYRFGKPTSFFYTFFSTLMVGLFALPIPHYLPNGNEGRHV